MTKRRTSERGVALIIVLLALLVLSGLAAAIVLATQTEIWTSYDYRLGTQSRYIAEAGQQEVMHWLMVGYTPPSTFSNYDMTKYPVQYSGQPVVLSGIPGVSANYPDASVQTAFNYSFNGASLSANGVQGTYSASATLLRMTPASGVSWLGAGGGGVMQTWEITTRGSVNGVRNATEQVVSTFERTGSSIFTYAVAATGTGCKAIDFSASSYTDSFNSSNGAYGGTNVITSGANVGTNGNITLSGSSKIDGTFSGLNTSVGNCPDGITDSSSSSPIVQGTATLTTAMSYPAPNPPSPTPPTTNQGINGTCPASIPAGCTQISSNNVGLSPNYQYGNLNISSGSTVVHLTAGTYDINSLTMSGGAQLVLDSYPVVINVAGTGVSSAVNLSGGNVYSLSAVPANFQLVYGGTDTMTLSGGSGSYGVVYAPNSAITMSGGSAWYGAIIGQTLTDSGGSPVHYDGALQNSLAQVGPYRMLNFSWSKY